MLFDQEKLERVVGIFQERLYDSSGDRVRQYLSEERNWDVERLRPFEVGYCPPEIPYPVRGQPVVEGRMWSMRGRLIIPIRDEFGALIALAGRKLEWCDGKLEHNLVQEFGVDRTDAMMDKWRAGKWINEMYQKKHHLYRLHDCRRSLAALKHVIVVEGYMDAIALADAGFNNTICLSGTKMTFWHMQALRRYGVEHLVLCLDSDSSGIEAAWQSDRASEEEEAATTCRIVLPEGLDPDETIINPTHGSAFRWALRDAARRISHTDKRIIEIDNVATRLAARRNPITLTNDGNTMEALP